MVEINISKDFSNVPAGRFFADGPYSGEAFRERHLKPALETGEPATINMDDAEGFGSSFLEEAFGGLIRYGYISKEDLHERLTIVSEDASLAIEVWDYIDAAEPHADIAPHST